MTECTFNVIVPTKPALTVTGSFSAFSASAFNFKSLRTTSPAEFDNVLVGITANMISQWNTENHCSNVKTNKHENNVFYKKFIQ